MGDPVGRTQGHARPLLAVGVRQGPSASGDIWISQLGLEPMARLTSDPALDQAPVWSADGQRVTFSSNRDGATPNLYWQRADGTGTAERLTTSSNEQSDEPATASFVFNFFDELQHLAPPGH